ncbi:hypothetical protein [Halomonas sp. N3-2A]|uniref:hypothetical protein n=1 Tax=Halomonas sp. N3-2A TaxID=2014541 RepID=UPI000B5B3D76|nr:hypothetical protein [Halomonas sp. N3-2A]ASK18886.1 hypothetical protein CEK60_06030 [Halomonas sp. N3-2A]
MQNQIRIDSPADLYSRPKFQEEVDFSPVTNRKLKFILQAYQFPEDQQIPCGISSCRTKHGRGFLVLTSDGLETNIGNRCGKKHLGADFDYERNRFNAEQRRAKNRQAVSDFRKDASQNSSLLDSVIERAKPLQKRKKQQMREHPSAWSEVKKLSKRRVSYIDNEDRLKIEDARTLHKKQGTQLKFTKWFDREKPTVADLRIRLDGLQAAGYDFHEELVAGLQSPLSELMALTDEAIDGMNDATLDKWRKLIQQVPAKISKAEDMIIETGKLLSPTNTLKFQYLPGCYAPDDGLDRHSRPVARIKRW